MGAPGVSTGAPDVSSAGADASGSLALLAPFALPPRLRLRVSLRAEADTRLSGWTGSMLHGALGHALKRVNGARRFADSAAYAAWMQAPGEPVQRQAGVGAAPALLLRPPRVTVPQRNVGAGETLDFELLAFRREPRAVADLLDALLDLGSQGLGREHVRFETVSICDGDSELLQAGVVAELPTLEYIEPAEAVMANPWALTVSLNTPTTLRREGVILREPELLDLVLAALRRLSAVAVTWGDGARVPHLGDLAERACRGWEPEEQAWRPFDVRRWSSRQQRQHPVRGVLGHARYKLCAPAAAGDAILAPTLLQRAAAVGIGKGTALGLGAISVFAGAD